MTLSGRAPIRYPGAKWNIAAQIIEHIPPHAHYVEPFFGSGAVFFTKDPSKHEVINDLDHRVVNFFRVLRDYPEELTNRLRLTPWAREEYAHSHEETPDEIENARRFAVRVWQAHASDLSKRPGWKNRGSRQATYGMSHRWNTVPDELLTIAQRLKDAEIEKRPALDLILRFATPDTVLYLDPPYLPRTRTQALYAHEMTAEEHRQLLEVITQHPGTVILSGYANDLYTKYLHGWKQITIKPSKVQCGAQRTETLWINTA